MTEQQQDVEAVEDRISAEQTAAEAKAAKALLSEKESAAKVPPHLSHGTIKTRMHVFPTMVRHTHCSGNLERQRQTCWPKSCGVMSSLG